MKLITLILFLFISSNSWAAVAVVQHKSFSCSSAASCAVTVTSTGTNNLLILAFRGGAIPSSVTDGTNNFAYASAWDNNVFVNVAYLPQSTAGKTTMTVNFSPNSNVSVGIFYEVSGFSFPIPDTKNSNASGVQSAGSATGPAVATQSTKGFVFAIDKTDGAVSGCTGAFTFTEQDLNGNGFCQLVNTTIGTKTPIFTDSGTTFTGFTMGFKENTGISNLN